MKQAPPPTLLLATANEGKRAEFLRLLPPTVRVLTLADLGLASPPEHGATFAENAALKATTASHRSGFLTLADDSGLEVDALGGAPGVRSARYGGEPLSDERNRQALLAALHNVPPARRRARFRCAIALARAGSVVAMSEGSCEGRVAAAPRGTLGFGYDPIFVLDDGRTMAELDATEKDLVSHRGQALRAILPSVRTELERPAHADATP